MAQTLCKNGQILITIPLAIIHLVHTQNFPTCAYQGEGDEVKKIVFRNILRMYEMNKSLFDSFMIHIVDNVKLLFDENALLEHTIHNISELFNISVQI